MSDYIRFLYIMDLWCIQRSLRRKDNLEFLGTLNGFSSKIVIGRLENGSLIICNGHHRLAALWLKGRREIYPDEYVLVELDGWIANKTNLKIPDLLKLCGINWEVQTHVGNS